MSLLNDGLGVIDVSASKNYMGNCHQQRVFIDGIQQSFGRNRNSVIGFDHPDARSVGSLRLPEIHYRGEIHVAVNDLIALAGEIEAGSDDGLASRHVLMSGDRPLSCIHQSANLIAFFRCQHPPPLFPGAHAACGPGVGVSLHGVVDSARHRAQGIAD